MVAAAGVIMLGSLVPGAAQDRPEMPTMTPEMEAGMAVWMQLAELCEHHGHMVPLAGSRDGEVTM